MDALYFDDELPYLGAAFGVLEAEGVVDAVGLGPDDERVCGGCQCREEDGRKKRTSGKGKKCKRSKETRRTLLPLIDVAGADAGLEDDLAVAGLCAGDEEGLLGGVVVVAKAECGALVDPTRVDELVDLSAWA